MSQITQIVESNNGNFRLVYIESDVNSVEVNENQFRSHKWNYPNFQEV
jgi:hypothetical protein